MFFLGDLLNKKTEMPKPDEALPGRDRPIPTASKHFVSKRDAQRPLPGRPGDRDVRPRLLLGRGAPVLADRGRLGDGGRLCRRHHAQPDLSGDLHRADRPCRGRARRLRSEDRVLCRPAEDLLGSARPDAGHAPGQRRRHDLPLGDLHLRRGAAAGGACLARRLRGVAARPPAAAGSPPRSRRRRPSISPRKSTSSIWRRTPTAIAACRAPASPAPFRRPPAGRRFPPNDGAMPGRSRGRACIAPSAAAGWFFRKVKIPREFCFGPCKIGP